MSTQFKPNTVKNSLSEFKLRWTAEPQPNAIVRFDRKQEPTMSISVHDNQPRLTVYTNIEGDRDNGKIEGNMDSHTFYAFLEIMRKVADDPEFTGAYEIENKGYFFGPQGKSEKPGVKSTTVVGRDSDGCVFISLISGKRPRIKFAIRPSVWHSVKRNGEEVSRSEVSSIYAKGQANLIAKLVAGILEKEHKTYEEIKERKEKNRQARANGGNKGGYGGQQKSNYQKPQASAPASNDSANDFDDAIPW